MSAGAHSADAADWSRRSAEGAEADERAREIEQQMTDDERFSLVISLIGPVPSIKNQNQLLGRLC